MRFVTVFAALALVLVGAVTEAEAQSRQSAPARQTDAQISQTPRLFTPFSPTTFLVHGNYCGFGNNGYDKPPVDALDRACQRHDLCYQRNGFPPPCGCNTQLRNDASVIANDQREPPDLQQMAGGVAFIAELMDCDPLLPFIDESRAEAERPMKSTKKPRRARAR